MLLGPETGPGIGDGQTSVMLAARKLDAQTASVRGMQNGVVQQIAGQFAQRPGVAVDLGTFSLNVKIQMLFGNQRCQVQGDLPCQLGPVLRGQGLKPLAKLLHLGQRQHLIGDLRGAVDGLINFGQGLHRLDIAMQRRLHLHLEHGERCFQLMGGIADEALLIVKQVAQAFDHLVGRLDQRLPFTRCIRRQHR